MPDICYCTNVFSYSTLTDLIEKLIPTVKSIFSEPPKLGLWLPQTTIKEATLDTQLWNKFLFQLDEAQIKIATFNAFPMGAFHGQGHKTDVYLPDWNHPLRVEYTTQLASIGVPLFEGLDFPIPISTLPICYGKVVDPQLSNIKKTQFYSSWLPQNIESLKASQSIDHIKKTLSHFNFLAESKGVHYTLALEPEPDCFLENLEESLRFFNFLQNEISTDSLLKHLSLCMDTCHFLVNFENLIDVYQKIKSSNIEISKIQLSNSPSWKAEQTPSILPHLEDENFLHQTRGLTQGQLNKYFDLDPSLNQIKKGEIRTHFHVPLNGTFSDYGISTHQAEIKQFLSFLGTQNTSPLLEIETYSYAPLIKNKTIPFDLNQSIRSEYQWVCDQLPIKDSITQ